MEQINQKIISAAGAFIFNAQDELFLAKNAKKFKQSWGIPGGKLEMGEDFASAAKREVREEIGVSVENLVYLRDGAFLDPFGNGIVYIDYMADFPKDFKPEHIQLNSEFSTWKFFQFDELDDLPMAEHQKFSAKKAIIYKRKEKIIEKLSEFHLGLIRNTVSYIPYQNSWHEAFLWIKNELNVPASLGELLHIGSTSIVNLMSKPILDLLLEYETKEQLENLIKILEKFGFAYKGDCVAKLQKIPIDENRHFFAYYNNLENVDYIHLHAFKRNHPEAIKLKEFKQILIENPILKEKYSKLKEDLVYNNKSRSEYTLGKGELIQSILKEKAIT